MNRPIQPASGGWPLTKGERYRFVGAVWRGTADQIVQLLAGAGFGHDVQIWAPDVPLPVDWPSDQTSVPGAELMVRGQGTWIRPTGLFTPWPDDPVLRIVRMWLSDFVSVGVSGSSMVTRVGVGGDIPLAPSPGGAFFSPKAGVTYRLMGVVNGAPTPDDIAAELGSRGFGTTTVWPIDAATLPSDWPKAVLLNPPAGSQFFAEAQWQGAPTLPANLSTGTILAMWRHGAPPPRPAPRPPPYMPPPQQPPDESGMGAAVVLAALGGALVLRSKRGG